MVQGGQLLNLKKLSAMANNFRLTGVRYISKGGHDSNDGTDVNSPKKSLNSFTGNQASIIVGAGYYEGTKTAANQNMLGDGKVVIKSALFDLDRPQDIHFLGSILRGGATNGWGFTRCIAQDCTFNFSHTHILPIVLSHILNSTFSHTSTGTVSLDRTVVLNSIITRVGTLTKDTYVNIDSILTYTVNPSPTIFRNNNIQGLIILGGVKYAIQDQFTGTPQDNGYEADVYWLNEANLTANGYTGTISGWNTAVATCINRDPKFNNVSKLDFTLQADSPHIGRALDGFSNIGGTEYAQSFYAGVSNPNILLFEVSESIDTTTNNNDWRLKAGENEGWIRAVIKVANNDVQISKIPYIGNYAFDSDAIGGSSTNMNVPDSKPVTNEYPSYLQTTAQAGNDTTLIIENHGASLGQWLWVDGQYREITGITDANTITFDTSLRAIVVVGTLVKIGAKSSLAALNPNRLNMKMRSSKAIITTENLNEPLIWDNDDLAPADTYLAQEWNNAPMIDNLNEVGFGDDDYDANYGNPINLKTVDIVIYLRNDYKS
jgi:hypothetical protein